MYTKKENYEWVVGFIDGGGFLDLERIKNRDRFYYRPILSITQKNIQVLYKIKKILKIGRISKRNDGYYHYRVRSRRLFEQYLVPIFTKYPFLSNKKLQFKLIVRCLKILKEYTDQDFQKQHCLNQFQIWIREARLRHLKTEPKNLSQTWLVGFFDSEGCISVQQLVSNLKWRFVIKMSQSETNYLLLVAIRNFLNIGRIYKERSNIYYWGIHSFKDLSKILSLFKKYPLKSEKHIQWIRFLKLLRIKDYQPEGNAPASQPEGHKGMSRRDARRECPVGAHLEETQGPPTGHNVSARWEKSRRDRPSVKIQKKFERLILSFQKQKRLKI